MTNDMLYLVLLSQLSRGLGYEEWRQRMRDAFERLKGSRAVRMLFSLALVAGLWPAASLAAPARAYADD